MGDVANQSLFPTFMLKASRWDLSVLEQMACVYARVCMRSFCVAHAHRHS